MAIFTSTAITRAEYDDANRILRLWFVEPGGSLRLLQRSKGDLRWPVPSAFEGRLLQHLHPRSL